MKRPKPTAKLPANAIDERSDSGENPERTFDLVLKVKCHASENEDPVVLWKFPEDFADQEVLQTVSKFCFPVDVERVSQNQVGQHFTFVLTDIESKQRFGFCRLTSGGKICLCILSYLPWFEVYYKLLNTLADYLAKELENDLNETLKSLYNHPVPKANTPVSLSVVSILSAMDVLSHSSFSFKNTCTFKKLCRVTSAPRKALRLGLTSLDGAVVWCAFPSEHDALHVYFWYLLNHRFFFNHTLYLW